MIIQIYTVIFGLVEKKREVEERRQRDKGCRKVRPRKCQCEKKKEKEMRGREYKRLKIQ